MQIQKTISKLAFTWYFLYVPIILIRIRFPFSMRNWRRLQIIPSESSGCWVFNHLSLLCKFVLCSTWNYSFLLIKLLCQVVLVCCQTGAYATLWLDKIHALLTADQLHSTQLFSTVYLSFSTCVTQIFHAFLLSNRTFGSIFAWIRHLMPCLFWLSCLRSLSLNSSNNVLLS